MALSKIQAESMNLADTYAFTGTISGIPAGVTEADQWRLTANFNSDATPISSNLARDTSSYFSKLGTGMTQSGGTFTFPSTGYWLVVFNATGSQNGGTEPDANVQIFATTNGSSFAQATGVKFAQNDEQSITKWSVETSFIFDITNTSTHKVQFYVSGITTNTYVAGGSQRTFMQFIKLGDT
jgi:hypothetical protein